MLKTQPLSPFSYQEKGELKGDEFNVLKVILIQVGIFSLLQKAKISWHL